MSEFIGDAIAHPEWRGSRTTDSGGGFLIDGEHVGVPIDIKHEDVVDRLKGRRIVGVAVEPVVGDWPTGNGVFLRLDDGALVEFSGWGYDAWGTDVRFWKDGDEAV